MAAGESSYHLRVAPPECPPATHGSRTMTLQAEQLDETDPSSGATVGTSEEEPVIAGTLKLRGGGNTNRRIQWDQDVVDNEGMGKKKSKICCIYHKPRQFGESSSDSSGSSSDCSSDEKPGDHESGIGGEDNSRHHHHHRRNKRSNRIRGNSPNAYEIQPRYKK